jgi:Domain of unknown function (DUF4145)
VISLRTDQLVCPHCGVAIHVQWNETQPGNDVDWQIVDVRWAKCPSCGRWIIKVGLWRASTRVGDVVVWPQRPRRPELPEEVPEPYRSDYIEALDVLPISAKASAALSRRLLQHTIREKAGIRRRSLDQEIDGVIEQGDVPGALAEDLDELRHLGNFAAHPIKVEHTGEVVDVEPGEAEACLNVLADLFDHYFVRSAVRERRRAALNKKLKAAGKPLLKRTADEPPEASQAS